MALRLRRGTDAQRAATTPADGELIWTTDTQELYVGGLDSVTSDPIVGGIRITGSQNDSPEELTRDLSLNSNVIFGTGTINIQGNITTNATVTANAFIGDGSGIYNLRAANLDTSDLVVEGGAYNLNVISDASTLLLDATNETLSVTGVTTNTLTSNTITANEVVSNFVGSLFADDSTTIIDGLNKNSFFANVELTSINSTEGEIEVTADTGSAGINASTADASSNVVLNRTSQTDDLLSDYRILSQVVTNINDSTNGLVKVGQTVTDKDSIFISHDPAGLHSDYTKMLVVKKDGIAFGTFTVDEKLVISDGSIKLANPNNNGSGGIKFGPTLQSEVGAGVEGQMYYDGGQHRMHIVNDTTTTVVLTQPFDSPVLEQATPTRFKNLSQAVIDSVAYAAAAVNGSTFFNSDTNTLETYKNNQWNGIVSQGDTFTGDLNGSVNLDDSTNIIAGDTGAITAPSYIQFGSFTTTERDALTAANGMVIYNTTDNKFQGYENGSWANLI